MTLTPLVSYDLGGFSTAMGSADLLSGGNYFFENAIVFVSVEVGTLGYSLEIGPDNPPAPEVGPMVPLMDISAWQQYRGWQMQSLYNPPAT
jgi:hypothetical protein